MQRTEQVFNSTIMTEMSLLWKNAKLPYLRWWWWWWWHCNKVVCQAQFEGQGMNGAQEWSIRNQ